MSFVFSARKCNANDTHHFCCRDRDDDNKCDENEGFCKEDEECKEGLVCGHCNCPDGFPTYCMRHRRKRSGRFVEYDEYGEYNEYGDGGSRLFEHYSPSEPRKI